MLAASFRVRLVAALAAAAVLGLAVAYLVVTTLDRAQENAADAREANGTVRSIAAEAARGAGPAALQAMQGMLPGDQVVVTREGHTVYAGPPVPDGIPFLTVSAGFPGGAVLFRDAETEQIAVSAQAAAVAAGMAVVVIGVAWSAATLLTRAIRDPVRQAISVADRLAAGDLTARMGNVGPAEFAPLARAFDQMASQAENADHEQRRFLADIAHEIATPLNAVAGFAVALADGSASTPVQRSEAAEVITSQAARLDGLLRDLRLLNRLDLTEAVRVEPVRVADLLHGLRVRFTPAARQCGVTLTVHAWRGLCVCDRLLLETVLDNLVSNAIRYTPADGSVQVRAFRRGRELIFSVRDSGIGIAAEHRQRIFGRLYRADEARDRAHGGSGLGLSIAQRAALALGGRIEVDSEVGKGSEFRFILPPGRDRAFWRRPAGPAAP